MSSITRLVAATLALLAIFQMAEYQVCGHGTSVSTASRIGFIAITVLPAVGIHLINTVAGRKWQPVVWTSYAAAAGFVGFFAFSKSAFANYACAGNYVIFHLIPRRGGEFFAYYYSLLIVGIFMALYFAATAGEKSRKALLYLVFGFLSFLLPVGIVNALKPETINGIPSIMCGFAVIYAIVLVFEVAPLKLHIRENLKLMVQKQIRGG